MRRLHLFVLAVIVAVDVAGSTDVYGQAETTRTGKTGVEFLEHCEATLTAANGSGVEGGLGSSATLCTELVRGLLWGLTLAETDGPVLCPPSGLTPEQAIRVVVEYLRDHPRRLHENDAPLIFEALTEAFPCQ